MSRKTTAALVAALGINFAMAGGALMLANLNKPAEFDIDDAFAQSPGDLTEVLGVPIDAAAGDVAVPLKAAQLGGNTRVTFSCGKAIPGGREIHEGTWDQITGSVLYRPEQQKLLAVHAVFDTRSLKTDAQALTNTVTVKEKWFDIENHPTATFACDEVVSVDDEAASHTHELVGTFTLNGITKPLTVPAKLSYAGQSLTIDAAFTILRSDFDVKKRSRSVAGTLGGVTSTVDDEVQMSVRVTASPDLNVVIAELAKQLEAQGELLRIAAIEREQLQSLGGRIDSLRDDMEQLAAQPRQSQVAVDIEAIPKTFVDYAEGDDGQIPFEMVLVPGDPAKGVAPFYMAKHEVTWSMFTRWMYCNDLLQQGVSASEIAKLIAEGARPSPLYEDPAQKFEASEPDKPAMAMSLISAKAYCRWLSEKTGRRYRLATLDEWRHAMALGGGLPDDLDASAWHAKNAPKNMFDDRVNSPAGAKAPNELGIHDMFGSVAEWVTGTGSQKTIVGGSFLTPPEDMSEAWLMTEDLKVWSETYPQIPKSRFWYSDVYYTGIRLVCEPASVVANPPEAAE